MALKMIDREENGVRVIRYPGARQSVKWRADCDYCLGLTTRTDRFQIKDPAQGFFPDHDAMAGCRSGGREHCTCDGCF